MANPLGEKSTYPDRYDPSLLYPIDRQQARASLSLPDFSGIDVWRAYELSWLQPSGKPVVAVAQFEFSAHSPAMVESKSFKLYLNSLNQERFASAEEVVQRLTGDLSKACGENVTVSLQDADENARLGLSLSAECLDSLEVAIENYDYDPTHLVVSGDRQTEETLSSHLLKSNCPVTGQPDWATVVLKYKGAKIQREGLLRYIVSFRDHDDFHEHCVEKMYADIWHHCQPSSLTVAAYYTRRGGLDINPIRSSEMMIGKDWQQVRTIRQ